MKGFRDLKIFRSNNIGISGFRDSKILGYSDFGIKEFWNLGIRGFRALLIVGFRNLGIGRSGDLRIEDIGILIFRFVNSQIQGFRYMIFRYYGI